MNVLTILIVIIVFGVILWLVNSFIPMDAKIKKILNIVAVILLVIYLLNVFNVFHFLEQARI